MNIHRFRIAEMYSNSQGKTSASLVASHLLVVTGCVMGIKGAFDGQGESMLQGIAFATLGAGLLGIRRFSDDKPVSESAQQNEEEK